MKLIIFSGLPRTGNRSRLTDRKRNIPGLHELEWSEAERASKYYFLWNEQRLVPDMAQPLDENY